MGIAGRQPQAVSKSKFYDKRIINEKGR